MKRTPLVHALAFAFAVAMPAASFAADAVAPAAATPAAKPVDTQAARAELAELRTQMQELSRKMAALSGQLGDAGPRAYAMRYLGDPDRGMIGVVVSKTGKSSKELLVSAVTPGSPAARAGIRVGDVFTSLSSSGTMFEHSGKNQSAADDLNDILRNLKVDQELTIEVRRDGKTLKFPLKAERREPYVIADAIGDASIDSSQMRADIERAQREAERAAREAQRIDVEKFRVDAEKMRRDAERMRVEIRRNMPWWGLNMAPLNAELGHYFGTEKGALVLAANAESLPGIRGGDVITRVADQDVARPEDVLRTLRDQPAGKNVPIRVLRERKTIALDVKAPEFNSIFEVAPPLPPTPPTPPAAPAVAPPAPPAPPSPPAKAPPAPPAPPTKPLHAPTPPSAPEAPQAPEPPDSEMS